MFVPLGYYSSVGQRNAGRKAKGTTMGKRIQWEQKGGHGSRANRSFKSACGRFTLCQGHNTSRLFSLHDAALGAQDYVASGLLSEMKAKAESLLEPGRPLIDVLD
jgi:hypothetical protein